LYSTLPTHQSIIEWRLHRRLRTYVQHKNKIRIISPDGAIVAFRVSHRICQATTTSDISSDNSNNMTQESQLKPEQENRKEETDKGATETEAIVEKLFPSLRRSEAEHCTFGKPSANLRLKESHIRKVANYARRRLEKMNWNVLRQEDYQENMPAPETHSQAQIGDLLGEGSFSSVFVRKEYPNQVVKVLRKKLIHNPAMLAACSADLVKEGWLLSVLAGSSNVVRIHGWQQNGLHSLINGFHDGFFLVLERLDFTLADKIKEWQQRKSKISNLFSFLKKGGLSSGEAKLLLLKERLLVIPHLARGIANLHRKGIIHRDLKPDNIGYSKGEWKIFDLDVARLCPTEVRSDYCSQEFKLTKRVGSPRYMSPECARGEMYNCLSDVYSFGLLVHELITLDKPYDEIPWELHDELIFYQHRRPDISNQWPISIKYFLDSAWHKDWKQRPILMEQGFHSSLADRILPEFLEYKQERYCPTKRSSAKGFFMGKTKSFRSNSPKAKDYVATVGDMGSSLSTLLTTSLRIDSRDVSPIVIPERRQYNVSSA
jgi:serine/threonine protein kinase